MKDRTDLYTGGVLQQNLFCHLSKTKKPLGNTSYPKEMIENEAGTANDYSNYKHKSKIGDQVKGIDEQSLEMSNTVHLCTKGFEVTYIFPPNASVNERKSGFKLYNIFKTIA